MESTSCSCRGFSLASLNQHDVLQLSAAPVPGSLCPLWPLWELHGHSTLTYIQANTHIDKVIFLKKKIQLHVRYSNLGIFL